MKVSVIMCAYNTAPFIERAIESMQAQTYTDWELIISDDQSKDNTLALAWKYKADKRIKIFEQPENLGYIKNKNTAFTYATGDLLTQLDADDTCGNTRLEKQVAAFINHPEIKICGTNYQMVDLQDKPVKVKEYESDFYVRELMKDYPFWFPGLMFRKELIDEFGMFSEYFSGIYGDDFYWTIRVNKKYPIYFIKNILYNYRVNPGSLTISYNGNNRKLIAEDIMAELYRQQVETGTDMLEQGKPEQMKNLEQGFLNNKNLMSEKYRIWAAKAVDTKNYHQAKELLKKSFALKKTNIDFYKTLLYYLRNRNGTTA